MVTNSSSTQPAGLGFCDILEEVDAHRDSWPELHPLPAEVLDLLEQINKLDTKSDSIWSRVEKHTAEDSQDCQAKANELRILWAKKQPLFDDYERTCRGLIVAHSPKVKTWLISLFNNILSRLKSSGYSVDDIMIVDAATVEFITDSPDADPDTPRRPRMKLKRGGALLTPNSNGAFESETRKRKRAPNLQIAQKRPRIEGTRNSIHFNAVYQNKRAARKHIIIRRPEDEARPGKFFILRCEEHDLHFDDSPLQAGLAHLVDKHQHQDASFDAVVENFGYEVIGCDDEKLAQNNMVAKEAFERGDNRARDSIRVRPSPSPERRSKGTNRETKKGRSARARRKRGEPINPTDLIPGNVYIIYWAASKQWFAGMLLPVQDLESVGIDDTVENMGLLNNIPPCYQYDSSSQSFSWAEGYEDGGPNASEQHFAFMFFEGVAFPDESHVAWIPLNEIQKWDEDQARLIEHSEQAFEYLKEQKLKQQPRQLGPHDEIPHSTNENSTWDFAPRSHVTESSTNLLPAQGTETASPHTAQEADTTEQAEEVPKDTDLEPEKAVQTNEQPDKTADEDIVMDSQENSAESVPQQPSEDSEDIVMETPEVVADEPSQQELQEYPESDGGDQEMILDTQEDPAEKVPSPRHLEETKTERQKPDSLQDPGADGFSSAESATSPKQPEEIHAEREKPESHEEPGTDRLSIDENVTLPKQPEETQRGPEDSVSPTEQGGERLSSADLQNLLDEGVDLEFHLSQSEQRESVDSPSPSVAPETTSLTQATHNFVNKTREQSHPLHNPVAMEPAPPKRDSIVPESSREQTPQPRLSYADMGRAASFSESSSVTGSFSAPNVAASNGTTIINSGVSLRVITIIGDSATFGSVSAIRATITNTATPTGSITTACLIPVIRQITGFNNTATIRGFTTFDSTTSTRIIISISGSLLLAFILTVLSSTVPNFIPPTHVTTVYVVISASGSFTEQPNIRPTSQTSQVLAPPRPSSVETVPPAATQPRSEVLRHPHALEAKKISQSPVKSPQPKKETPEVNPKASVAVILLNGGSVEQARSQSTAPGHKGVDDNLPQRPTVHQQHSEPVPTSTGPLVTSASKPGSPAPRRPLPQGRPSPKPSASPVKSRGAPQAKASQHQVASSSQPASSQPASTIQQTPAAQPSPRLPPMEVPQPRSVAEKTPVVQPNRPAQQLPSHQPSVRHASRPASPASRPSPRLPPMDVPRSAPPSQAPFIPHTLVSQQKSPSPVPVPQPRSVPQDPSATQAPEHRPSPSLPPMDVPQSASPLQGHYVPHTMLAQQHAALSNPPDSTTKEDSSSQPVASPRQPSTSFQRPGSALQGKVASPPMPSPRQAAASISRPHSAVQNHVGSPQMYSPRPSPIEVSRPSLAYQGSSTQYPMPSPRGPYAVPVAPPQGSPHQTLRHFLPLGNDIYGQNSVTQRHWTPTGELSPRLPSMEAQLPPMRLPNISRPRSGPHAAPNTMASPQKNTMGSPPVQQMAHLMQSPRQSAAEIPRPHTAANMRPPSAMSPMLGHAEPPRPNSSYAQNVPFHAPLPTMIPAHSNPHYQSSAPSAHRYAKPNPPPGHIRRHSESGTFHHTQQYALGDSPQIANSTPRSHQSHELDPNIRCYMAPFLPELSPNVRKALLRHLGTNQQDLFPGDFLNAENKYRCLLCRETTPEPREFIDHLKMRCPMLEEIYKQDREEKAKEAMRAKGSMQTKRKSQAPQAKKNARVRC
ncbi:hypothetical protein FBEOM_5992 [Fusarium beomiforme]|uniref:Uncharacterized protein n=1 Tax=Fusarium beomiforme TaxID=44412 RepID=A0A9P5AJZ1_9HYPO|nr:hypothetical protein FBEOM_5992 [Fusarium beomiforme]